MLNHILTGESVTVVGDDFVPRTIPSTHPAFTRVVDALKAGNDNEVKTLMDLPNAIASFMQGKIQVTERTLFYDGKPVTNSLAMKILQFMEAGDEELAKPLINFLEKVKQNPSRRAAEGLYDWSVRSGLPITPEGDILAWKIVRSNYHDYHSGRFDNSVGKIVEVARNEVDEDPDRTCSYGLHFCSTAYLPHYYHGSDRRIMVVKINPADVVAFPRDYNISKGRACRYEVIGEVPEEKAKDFFPSPVSSYFTSTGSDYVNDTVEPIVGRHYETRDGRIVQITDHEPDGGDEFPYRGEDENGLVIWYTETGAFWSDDNEHDLDLVELLPEDFEQSEPALQQKSGFFSQFLDALFGKND